MSANVSGDHTIRVRSALGLPVVMEAAAMFVDALVDGRTVGESTFLFEFDESGNDEVLITARLRHPTSENPVRKALTPIYNLMAGFYRAGADVVVAGELAEVLPGRGALEHDPAGPRPAGGITQIFEDHLSPVEKTPPVNPALLEEVFHALADVRDFASRLDDPHFRTLFPASGKDHRDDATYYLTHRDGLQFVALVKDDAVYAHGIHAHVPLSARLQFDFFDVTPRAARTWGEVWVNHSHGGRFARLGALEILPDEIALVHDIQIVRYRVDDRASLADLTDLGFGPGRSRVYSASVWLAIAEQYGENQRYQIALRCAEQAALVAESAEQAALADQEIDRWQGWLTFTAQQAAGSERPERKPASISRQPLAALLARLTPFCAARLKQVCDTIQLEHWDSHDSHRRVQALREIREVGPGGIGFLLTYPRLTGQTLLDALVTPQALAHLGYRFEVIPPPVVLDDIFTIQCGDTVIWGSVESQRLIVRDDPNLVYSAIP